MSLSFSSPTESHDVAAFCHDSNPNTFCQNKLNFDVSSGVWEGHEDSPSLFIRLVDAFFDEVVSFLFRDVLFLL